MAELNNTGGECFALQKSKDDGYWVATDTLHGVMLKFREHYLNADQEVTLLNGKASTVAEVTKVAAHLRELSDWLTLNHRDICQPTRRSRLIELGAKIKALRTGKKITLEQMEVLTGIGKGNLSTIENGKQAATLDTLYRIAYALDAKIDIVPM